VARDGLIESRAPFCEATLLGGEIVAFVGYIIDQAHKGV
jgi:hypothetical protein